LNCVLFKSRKWRSTINSRRPAPPRTQPAQHAHPSNHALMLHQHPVSPALVHHMPMNHALMLHQHPVSPALVHHMPMQVSPALVHHMPMHLSSAPSVSSTCPSHAHAPFIILIFARFCFVFCFCVCVCVCCSQAEGMETFEDICTRMGWEIPEVRACVPCQST
jgi:hypothetical protein